MLAPGRIARCRWSVSPLMSRAVAHRRCARSVRGSTAAFCSSLSRRRTILTLSGGKTDGTPDSPCDPHPFRGRRRRPGANHRADRRPGDRSADGRPLPGIQVTVTGTSRGAVSDTAGRFTITDVPVGQPHGARARHRLRVGASRPSTVAGGQRGDRRLHARRSRRAQLRSDRRDRLRRAGSPRSVTGAISTVQADKLKDIPTSDPMKALQGRVAGVEIVASSNEPGAAMNVRIRGVRSLDGEQRAALRRRRHSARRRHPGLQPGR